MHKRSDTKKARNHPATPRRPISPMETMPTNRPLSSSTSVHQKNTSHSLNRMLILADICILFIFQCKCRPRCCVDRICSPSDGVVAMFSSGCAKVFHLAYNCVSLNNCSCICIIMLCLAEVGRTTNIFSVLFTAFGYFSISVLNCED